MPKKVDWKSLFPKDKPFGKWTVTSDPFRPKGGRGHMSVECRCDCGRIKVVHCANLSRGLTTQCKDCTKLGTFADEGKKTCSSCRNSLDTSKFYKCVSYPDGLQTICMRCHKLRTYDLTEEELAALEQRANGVCECCRLVPYSVIDHCHKSGRVRGLICQRCNIGLGQFDDSIAGIEKALVYLKWSDAVLPRSSP